MGCGGIPVHHCPLEERQFHVYEVCAVDFLCVSLSDLSCPLLHESYALMLNLGAHDDDHSGDKFMFNKAVLVNC